MNKNLLLILVAGVDIWAALFITQLNQPANHWAVSLAISDQITQAATTTQPIQIWMRKNGSMGIYPRTGQTMTVDAVCECVEAAGRDTDISVRLLCEPNMEFQDWSPLVLRLAKHTRRLSLAPLPIE